MDFENKQLNDEEKALRTYTSDMADAIRQNEVSVIKIALAEKEKREQENIYKQAEGTKTSKIFFVIGGIILISVGLVGSYYLFQKNGGEFTKVSFDDIYFKKKKLLLR